MEGGIAHENRNNFSGPGSDREIVIYYFLCLLITDDALRIITYLVTVEVLKKWTMPLKDWDSCISQFAIQFSDRFLMVLVV